MGFTVRDIITDLAKSVEKARLDIKRGKLPVYVPEVEITLNLEAELDGEEEIVEEEIAETKQPEVSRSSKEKVEATKKITAKRYVLDEKLLKQKGISFRKVGTTSKASKERTNLTLRLVFTPDEEVNNG